MPKQNVDLDPDVAQGGSPADDVVETNPELDAALALGNVAAEFEDEETETPDEVSPDEEPDSQPTPKVDLSALVAQIGKLNEKIDALQRRTTPVEEPEYEEVQDFDPERARTGEGWEGVAPPIGYIAEHQAALTKGHQAVRDQVNNMQLQLAFLQFHASHPDWEKYDNELSEVIQSGTISFSRGARPALETAWKHVLGQKALEKAEAEKKRQEAGALRHVPQARPGTRDETRVRGSKLLSLEQSLEMGRKAVQRGMTRGRSS